MARRTASNTVASAVMVRALILLPKIPFVKAATPIKISELKNIPGIKAETGRGDIVVFEKADQFHAYVLPATVESLNNLASGTTPGSAVSKVYRALPKVDAPVTPEGDAEKKAPVKKVRKTVAPKSPEGETPEAPKEEAVADKFMIVKITSQGTGRMVADKEVRYGKREFDSRADALAFIKGMKIDGSFKKYTSAGVTYSKHRGINIALRVRKIGAVAPKAAVKKAAPKISVKPAPAPKFCIVTTMKNKAGKTLETWVEKYSTKAEAMKEMHDYAADMAADAAWEIVGKQDRRSTTATVARKTGTQTLVMVVVQEKPRTLRTEAELSE